MFVVYNDNLKMDEINKLMKELDITSEEALLVQKAEVL